MIVALHNFEMREGLACWVSLEFDFGVYRQWFQSGQFLPAAAANDVHTENQQIAGSENTTMAETRNEFVAEASGFEYQLAGLEGDVDSAE